MGLNQSLFPQMTPEQRASISDKPNLPGRDCFWSPTRLWNPTRFACDRIDGFESNRLSRALMRRGFRRARRRLSKKRRRDISPHNPDQAVFRQIRWRKLAMCMFFFYKRWVCRNVGCPAPVARGFCDKQSRRRSGEPPTLRPFPISPCRRRAGARRGVCPLLQIR